MFKLINILLVITIAVASTEASNCDCPVQGDISPVCGTDGITYPNRENLMCHKRCNRSNVRVASSEHGCQCECANTRELLPVCASDGNTYVNPGAVRCHNKCYNENIRILSYLPCHKNDIGKSM